MVRKYEWELEPEDSLCPTMAFAEPAFWCAVRPLPDADQVANDIGMSCPVVERYMRFRDQMKVAWPASGA
ncbi:MAG TPA: hypothetical protein VMF32_04955 [Xanthobacteraceae bacterium]|nr:hypothetical protein [Xanthobacteraceae bacterium]